MNIGFSQKEYQRVREWLMTALEMTPDIFSEVELLEKLQSNEWILITTEHSACVLQTYEEGEQKNANVLLVGGKRGGSLRELMTVLTVVSDLLKRNGYSRIVGQPRKEWHKYLTSKHGFKEQQKEYYREL